MNGMTEQERRLYDAQADHEAWSLTHEILEQGVRSYSAFLFPLGPERLQ
ncbi:hypothetical protein BH20ACT11_BH20ACT11_08790 [soil metagenome]